MNESILQTLCGLKVSGARLVAGKAGISFENGTTLAIFNRFTLTGIAPADAGLLVGEAVSGICEAPNTISIEFGSRASIRIDMRDNAYTGPEAMELCSPGEPIAIWN
ncbi:hypothetical protein D3C80_1213540 [compost metagenome]